MLLISKLNKIPFFFITSITYLFILSIVFISCILNPCVIYLKMKEGDVYFADCATTHTIL